MTNIVLFNKPYGVLSQFRDDSHNEYTTLSDYFTDKSLRVAGRLDATSEGLLLLTSDGKLNKTLTHPPKANHGKKHGKTYWVQVEGVATHQQVLQLSQGVLLKDGLTLPAIVKPLLEPNLWQRYPPIRERKNIPTSWLEITIFEGKNRQIRRMTASVGLPCLRLVRVAIGDFKLNNLAVGEFVRIHLSKHRLQALGLEN